MKLVIALTLGLVTPHLAASQVPDPGAAGPYVVGHTSFSVIDTSRNTTSPFGGRPIPIHVWYPVDESNVTDQSVEAIYPLDPIYGRWHVSTSSAWEQVGMARAYENTAVSVQRPFPLVIFSPGWGNRYFQYLFYAHRLASHGFVVAITQHYRDGAYAWDGTNCQAEIPTPFPPNCTNHLATALFNRPRDVSFMLDVILALNNQSDNMLFNSVRPNQVVAAGHSLGGYAALALTAGDDDVCAETALEEPFPTPCTSIGWTAPDPRITAIITLDAGNQHLHFSELARVSVPSMALGQAAENLMDDGTVNNINPGVGSRQARQHAAISGRPNYRADVLNALHQSFTNSCSGVLVVYWKMPGQQELGPSGDIPLTTLQTQLAQYWCNGTVLSQAAVYQLAAKYAIAFLKTHISNESGYHRMLTGGWALTNEDHIEFFVTEPSSATALGEDPSTFQYFVHQPGTFSRTSEKDTLRPAGVEEQFIEW